MRNGILLEVKNALIAAVVSALVASTATYAAGGLINGRKIVNRSIPASKLTPEAVRSLRGKTGATGVQGLTGPAGTPGHFDPNLVTVVGGTRQSVDAGATVEISTSCPAGQVAIGGGAVVGTTANPGIVSASHPFALGVSYPNQWDAVVENPSGSAMFAHVDVACAAS